MNKPVLITMAGVAMLAGLLPALADDQTDALIQEVTRTAKTPAERAMRLYEAAQMVEEDAELQAKLLSEAVEQGLEGVAEEAGRNTAEKALDDLVEKQAGKAGLWRTKREELYRRWYRVAQGDEKRSVGRKLIDLLVAEGERQEQAGEWAQAVVPLGEASTLAAYLRLREQDRLKHRHHRAAYMSTVERRVEGLKTSLEKTPGDATVRGALVRALVVEMDRPDEATEFLSAELDETWRTYVPLAAQPVDRLQARACLELGDWYFGDLTKGTNDFTREWMLRRARTYYERFAALHEGKDAAALKAKVALDNIADELAKLEVPLRPEPEEQVAKKPPEGEGEESRERTEGQERDGEGRPPAEQHPYRRLIDRWRKHRWRR